MNAMGHLKGPQRPLRHPAGCQGDSANLQACTARVEAMLADLEDGDPAAAPLREAQEMEDGVSPAPLCTRSSPGGALP